MGFVILGNTAGLRDTVNYSETIRDILKSRYSFFEESSGKQALNMDEFLQVIQAYGDNSNFYQNKLNSLKNSGKSFQSKGRIISLSEDSYSMSKKANKNNPYDGKVVYREARAFSNGDGQFGQPICETTSAYVGMMELRRMDFRTRKKFYKDFKKTLESKFSKNGSSDSRIQVF